MTTVGEYRCGSRVLRSGEVIRIRGARGLFTIQGFDPEAGTVDVYGGPGGRRMFRTFTLDRIGAKPREANRRAKASA